jgi:hypothetical protein
VGDLIFLEVQVIKGGMGGQAAEYMAFYGPLVIEGLR